MNGLTPWICCTLCGYPVALPHHVHRECASRQIENAHHALRRAQHKTALAVYAMERAYERYEYGDKRLKSAITKWQRASDKERDAEQRHYLALLVYSDFVKC